MGWEWGQNNKSIITEVDGNRQASTLTFQPFQYIFFPTGPYYHGNQGVASTITPFWVVPPPEVKTEIINDLISYLCCVVISQFVFNLCITWLPAATA